MVAGKIPVAAVLSAEIVNVRLLVPSNAVGEAAAVHAGSGRSDDLSKDADPKLDTNIYL